MREVTPSLKSYHILYMYSYSRIELHSAITNAIAQFYTIERAACVGLLSHVH